MDLTLLVYGISVLDKIQPVLGMIIASTMIALIVSLGFRFIGLTIESWDGEGTVKRKMQQREPLEKWIKRLFIILGITSMLAVAVPSEKTAYMMVGAYATQKIAENDKVQETGQKVLKLIEQKLDTYIDEGIKDAEKKVKTVTKGESK